MTEEKLPGVIAAAKAIAKPKLKLVHGISGEVLMPDVGAERVAKVEALRDRLDEMARTAHEEGRTDDAAALDAGSFAMTYVLKEAQ